jgi:hypothetical protein
MDFDDGISQLNLRKGGSLGDSWRCTSSAKYIE